MKKIAILCMTLISQIVFSQGITICNSKEEADSVIDCIIKKDFYKDSIGDSARVFFYLKIDSVGEIHSCRITKDFNKNIDEGYYNLICSEIEDRIRMPFLYEKSRCNGKYCRWGYPYTKPRKVIR